MQTKQKASLHFLTSLNICPQKSKRKQKKTQLVRTLRRKRFISVVLLSCVVLNCNKNKKRFKKKKMALKLRNRSNNYQPE